jgi:predicted phage-related endonuclease
VHNTSTQAQGDEDRLLAEALSERERFLLETQEERENFLSERKKGVGGSDIASVFNEGYGCKLRLWREKRDEIPDYPREENDAMLIGKALEPIAAMKYERESRRSVVILRRPVIHPLYPELRVNVDRMIMPSDSGEDVGNAGVLEIKSVGRGAYYKYKREGLPPDYILQLQHGIECTQTLWGAFAMYCRDNGDLTHWEVRKDNDLAPVIVEKAREFWRDVQTGVMPNRLEPDDPRCQRCEYRRSCQGNALIQIELQRTLGPLVRELKERQVLLDQASELVEESKEELKTKLGDRQAVIVNGSTIYYRPQTAMRGDFKALAADYEGLRTLVLEHTKTQPEMHAALRLQYPPADDFKKPSPSRPLRIF